VHVLFFFETLICLFKGAPCFPTTSHPYYDAAIYERWDDETDVEAVSKRHEVLIPTAKKRLQADVQSLLDALNNWKEPCTRIVVTHGCPDECAASSRDESPFAATCKLGDKAMYKRFADAGLRYWFCGAPLDKCVMLMRYTKTLLCSNCYMPSDRELPSKEAFTITRENAAGI